MGSRCQDGNKKSHWSAPTKTSTPDVLTLERIQLNSLLGFTTSGMSPPSIYPGASGLVLASARAAFCQKFSNFFHFVGAAEYLSGALICQDSWQMLVLTSSFHPHLTRTHQSMKFRLPTLTLSGSTSRSTKYPMQRPLPMTCGSTDSTPPDQTIVLPPWPPASSGKPSPAVVAVVRLFQLHRDGELDSVLTNIRLSLAEHTELWRRLEKDSDLAGYVADKVRYGRGTPGPDPETAPVAMAAEY